MTTEAIISTMVDRIVGRFGPSRVVLFGSYARGTAIESSDVDLLVVMGNGTDKRRTAVEIRRSLGDLPVSKDIVVATTRRDQRAGVASWEPCSTRRLREGRVVYERP